MEDWSVCDHAELRDIYAVFEVDGVILAQAGDEWCSWRGDRGRFSHFFAAWFGGGAMPGEVRPMTCGEYRRRRDELDGPGWNVLNVGPDHPWR
jgi:hypothetical protein